MTKLRVLDLFSGIGGFSLGLERTNGFETVAFCEIEEFPRRVLAKHWPDVPCYDDVRTLTAARLAADGIAVDVICGGFPCQDISNAGRGLGLSGERSGLWSEIARLVGELAPRFVVVENVAALLGRGLGDVLGDLASLGYDAEWHCIPASALGAHHRRDRLWLVAHPNGEPERALPIGNAAAFACPGDGSEVLAHAIGERQPRQGQPVFAFCPATGSYRQAVDAFASGLGDLWRIEPAVGRVAHGVPDRLDRLKALGNAVVPQIPELIGNAILASLAKEAA
jgi:DNA (cytosine-5)-methyltransferase 1